VVNSDPIASALLAAAEGKTIRGRKLLIKSFTPDSVGHCHVLFVGDSAGASPGDLLKKTGTDAVLTIGESQNFTDNGGIIRFSLEDRKVRFEINAAAAERARLQVSSKLLKLAKVVNK
jgi:hypothetical protein